MKKVLIAFVVFSLCSLQSYSQLNSDQIVSLDGSTKDSISLSKLKRFKLILGTCCKNWTVESFSLAVKSDTGVNEVSLTGDRLNKKGRHFLRQLERGQELGLVNIKVKGSDGRIRHAANQFYKIE